MTVSPPDPDATLSGVSLQMFVTRHADHDTAVDGGVLRRDGEATCRLLVVTGSPACRKSHTHSRGMLETCGLILSVRSLGHMGMMVSGLMSIEPSPRSSPFVTVPLHCKELSRLCATALTLPL